MLLLILLLAVLGAHTIPVETNRVHLGHGLDQWLGDSPKAIYEAATRPMGHRFADINVWTCLDDIVCLHSHTARITGYHYIRRWHRLGRRKMTAAELDRHVHAWKASDIKRWRRTQYKGQTYESKAAPMLLREMLAIAKPRAVVITPELKDPQFVQSKWALFMRQMVDAIGAKIYPMTLVTMQGWGSKLKNLHDIGRFEVALLQHGAQKPADLAQWRPYIDAFWGAWGPLKSAPSTF